MIKVGKAVGSGFIITSDGLILTNAHLLSSVGESQGMPIEVKLSSGEIKRAVLNKSGTPPLDVAVLKIDGSDYSPLVIAEKGECTEGEEVIAIGAPLGLDYTMTKGIISNCKREFQSVEYIQTDASINDGNSGGPLLNKKGQVIGISTIKIKAVGVEGLNFALSSTFAKDYVDGNLSSLEASLKAQKEEEDKQALQQYTALVDAADKIFTALKERYLNNYNEFTAKLNYNLNQGRISYSDAQNYIHRQATTQLTIG